MASHLSAIADALDLPEDELRSLRSAALADPIRAAPLRHLHQGQEHLIEPGDWRNEWAHPHTGLPPACPVIPLGSDGEAFYFLNTLGQVHVLKAASSGKGPIDALFQGRSAYLEWAWPRWGKQNSVKGYEADECRRDLFDACAFKGTFELEDRVRGRGCWRDDDGGLIYHAGDQVLIGGKWRPCGEQGRFIYPARPKLGRPALRYESAGSQGAGAKLFSLLQTWNWDRGELDARLMLGWMITAMIGGALDQRPVTFVVGQEGSGKTTLQKMLKFLMLGAFMSTSNTTQAGIYQRVKQDSVAIMVDELEAKEDTRRSDQILELARIAYSGDKMNRGGADHQAREFSLMSSFMGSSIAMPPIDAQDQSRMALLMLRPHEELKAEIERETGETTPARVVDELAIEDWFRAAGVDAVVDAKQLEAWGRLLLRRVFDWYPRWAGLRNVFRQALMTVGHNSRSADTFAPLAAGYHLALHDDVPSAEQIAEWLAWLKADVLEETASRKPTWRRCFDLMLQAQPEVFRHAAAKRRSVGDYLAHYQQFPAGLDDCNDNLPLCGLALSFAKSDPEDFEHARLFVPVNHPALRALFEGTAWAGRLGAPGPWAGVLRQMPKHLWWNGKSDKGLDKKAAGIFIKLAEALEA